MADFSCYWSLQIVSVLIKHTWLHIQYNQFRLCLLSPNVNHKQRHHAVEKDIVETCVVPSCDVSCRGNSSDYLTCMPFNTNCIDLSLHMYEVSDKEEPETIAATGREN